MKIFNTDSSTKPCADTGWGREGRDRETLELSDEALVKEVFAANPKTVLVLISSYPFAVNWSQAHVPAILHLAHASQEQGAGLGEVLFGAYNPAGRVAETWPVSATQLPPMMDYDIAHGRTYLYSTAKPLYAFGHGLSYTTFQYSKLKFATGVAGPGGMHATVDVKNTGKLAGDEVVQLYVTHTKSAVSRPIRELKAFDRVNLKPGETRTVHLDVPLSSIAYWDVAAEGFRVEADTIELGVGAASDDIRMHSSFVVTPQMAAAANLAAQK